MSPSRETQTIVGASPRQDTRSLVLFTLDESQFGLNGSAVQEVVRAVAIAAVPTVTPLLEGVVNVRGRIVPVLDLRHRLYLPPRALDPSQFLILATAGTRLIALRVDRVLDLMTVAESDIDPATTVPGTRFVEGIVRLKDGLIVIQDLSAFLSLDEGARFDEAARAAISVGAGNPPSGDSGMAT